MREASQSDYPPAYSRISQCPRCWRMFGADSTAELHKPWRKPVTDDCKAPEDLGLVARDRNGIAVWVRPDPRFGDAPT